MTIITQMCHRAKFDFTCISADHGTKYDPRYLIMVPNMAHDTDHGTQYEKNPPANMDAQG